MKWIKTYENFNAIFSDRHDSNRNLRPLQQYRIGPEQGIITGIIDKLQNGIDITEEDKKELDRISGYDNLYDIVEKWLEKIFNVFRKHSYEDIEDRLVEFFDEIPKFTPHVMFSISKKGSHIGISSNKLDNKDYFKWEIGNILRDMMYECTKPYDRVSIDEYLSIKKPALYITLNHSSNINTTKQYNLEFLESLVDRIYNRVKQLYDVDSIQYNLDREGRKYDTNVDVSDYNFIIYLN